MDFSVFDSFPRLETARLIMRRMTLADQHALMGVFGDPQVTITTDIEVLTKTEEAAELIEALDSRYRNKQGLRWGHYAQR